ncbi:HNH endonuclease [Mesorhizobium sp. RCC_202]|uniref:HNH endonuclease n=1 Tax=Mesorhizobium sp. RCC_202 TaxID=3239222 RepID=UPI0035254843
MERDPRNAMLPDDIDNQIDVAGDLPGAKDQSDALAPLYDKIRQALDKTAPAEVQPVADQPVVALLADLSPETMDALLRQARATNLSQLIGAHSDISLAFQNAPKAFAETGSYSGVMHGPEDFASVFGVEEGGRQFAKLDQQVKTGKQAFEMRAMPNQEINNQLLDAAVSSGRLPEGQSRYRITAAAARQVQEARRNDPAGEAVKAFPQANDAWRAAAAEGWRDPATVQNALALTIAAQHYLGVETVQPVPRSVLKDLGALPLQAMWAGMNGLLAGTADPIVKASVKQQFAEAGLLGGSASGAAIFGPMAEKTQASRDPAAGDVVDRAKTATQPAGLDGTPSHLFQTSPVGTENSVADRTRREAIVDPMMLFDVRKAVELGLVNNNQVENYTPTLRDKIGSFLVGDSERDSVWRNIARSFVGSEGGGEEGFSVADITPAGVLFAGDKAITSALYGNYGDAALNALGAIPADRLAAIGLKQAGKIVSPLVDEVPRVLKWSDELGEGAETLIRDDGGKLAKSAGEVLPEGADRYEGVDDLSKLQPDAASGEAKTPTGQFYSVVFETKLDSGLYPSLSRPRHFQAANEALLVLMEREPDFAKILQEAGINLQRTKRGLVPRRAPPGYTWHHAPEPGVMQLVPRYQHDPGTIFQKALHPNRRGGFSLWGK